MVDIIYQSITIHIVCFCSSCNKKHLSRFDFDIKKNMENIRLVIGERVKELRLSQNLTQSDLSSKAGITRANLSNIEAGKYNVSLDTMYKIACALGKEVKIV